MSEKMTEKIKRTEELELTEPGNAGNIRDHRGPGAADA